MVDFKKKLHNGNQKIMVDPIDIYNLLDRKSEKSGPLRNAQKEVLTKWYQSSDNKDTVIKLSTGAGKTLVGLLILESNIRKKRSSKNKNYGMELYLCNNNNLVRQTREQADLFGINVETSETGGDIPESVIAGDAIFITSAQSFFNGQTKFNNSDIPNVNTIILDDAHSTTEIIKDSLTLTITKKDNSDLYHNLIDLLSDGLQSQGEGTFSDIKNDNTSEFIPVPYWFWIKHSSEITKLISDKTSKYSDNPINKSMNELFFAWPTIKNMLDECDCIVSSKKIEIRPLKYPINFYEKFTKASHRVFMSATTASDNTLINDLNVKKESVKSPITYNSDFISGEKMVIIPSIISDQLDRSTIVKKFGQIKNSSFGITTIVPGYYRTKDWENYGSKIADSKSIDNILEQLNKKQFKSPLVLVNRYDGIDLPDDTTRILILDSLPQASSLFDEYYNSVVTNSSENNLRIAQKIEQGMGRSVRADTDYTIIILTGTDLVRFIRNPQNKEYFSPQLLKQINIGIENSKEAQEEPDGWQALVDLMTQSLKRNEDWKAFYRDQMKNVPSSNLNTVQINYTEKKREIFEMAADPLKDINKLKNTIDKFVNDFNLSNEEKGWYYQLYARSIFSSYEQMSNNYQKKAYQLNHKLLLPNNYNPINKIEGLMPDRRISNIIKQFKEYENIENLNNVVADIVANLSFGVDKKKFEESLDEMGKILGFATDRPDEYYKKGPDHLWSISDNSYFIIEDKSEVKEERNKIYKQEIGQMNNSIGWFKDNYHTSTYQAFLIIPTKYPDPAGGFNGNVKIIRKKGLKRLKNNFKKFIDEICLNDLYNLSNEQVHNLLITYELTSEDLMQKYAEIPVKSN